MVLKLTILPCIVQLKLICFQAFTFPSFFCLIVHLKISLGNSVSSNAMSQLNSPLSHNMGVAEIAVTVQER